MARIFNVSQSGKLTEYESSEYAKAANEFATVEFETTAKYSLYRFLNGEDFSDTLVHKNWKVRFDEFSFYQRCKYTIMDKKGIMKQYLTDGQNLEGLSEMILEFARVTEFNDFKDHELHQREQALQNEHKSLQEQINELKAIVEVLKGKLELSPNVQ